MAPGGSPKPAQPARVLVAGDAGVDADTLLEAGPAAQPRPVPPPPPTPTLPPPAPVALRAGTASSVRGAIRGEAGVLRRLPVAPAEAGRLLGREWLPHPLAAVSERRAGGRASSAQKSRVLRLSVPRLTSEPSLSLPLSSDPHGPPGTSTLTTRSSLPAIIDSKDPKLSASHSTPPPSSTPALARRRKPATESSSRRGRARRALPCPTTMRALARKPTAQSPLPAVAPRG